MPDFWQFPTGSMGLGPISAIYQARFMRYLRDRGLADRPERHVWGVFGDGEMDEPESIGALTLAAREKLDNLTFVINCNLQRLDGPVRGNGQIIQELESLFAGAGWNVDQGACGAPTGTRCSRCDREHALLRGFARHRRRQVPDPRRQGRAPTTCENFFGQNRELKALVAHMSEREVDALRRGGHDLRKLHAAFAAAQATQGRPDRDPRQDQKGLRHGRGRRVPHDRAPGQEARRRGARRPSATASPCRSATRTSAALKFFRPAEDSPELAYLRERRAASGGALPGAGARPRR